MSDSFIVVLTVSPVLFCALLLVSVSNVQSGQFPFQLQFLLLVLLHSRTSRVSSNNINASSASVRDVVCRPISRIGLLLLDCLFFSPNSGLLDRRFVPLHRFPFLRRNTFRPSHYFTNFPITVVIKFGGHLISVPYFLAYVYGCSYFWVLRSIQSFFDHLLFEAQVKVAEVVAGRARFRD